jgi:hypothetical protein
VFHVLLHEGVVELLADQTLCVLHSVGRVLGNLVLCGVSDQTLLVGEGYLRGCSVVTHVVGDDLNVVVAEYRDA